MDFADIVDAATIAHRIGVSRSAVANWRARYADFPEPLPTSTINPVFSWRAVERWHDA